uniref:MICOS complex subunit n=1 Tax=Takifugu rubripes TaxID=31033 RepID=H2T0P6_TAKRU
MAAKVAVVAVPTVLGVASIRVYTVKEKPTEGLLPRERLNIYTPLPQSAQAQVVPERSGIIQSGITTSQDSLYTKDPCDFVIYKVIKFALCEMDHGSLIISIDLALLGSRFKRTVVPLGLMSAAASVCYPAQAVAVVKVTGKKVYAAGQWSSAAVASLFASKPQEPVTKDPTSPQPQSAEDQSTKDTLAQSPTCPQTEAALNESVPVSDQPVIAVISEEVSSVTPAEIPPSQTPSDTGMTDHLCCFSQRFLLMSFLSALQLPPLRSRQTQNRSDGSGFKADPALMDFGQSSPEDEDLYSTRS